MPDAGKIKQLNIAFFEHRNSDDICAVKWEQVSINGINMDNAQFGEAYKTKYDVSHSVGHGECRAMADWITKQFEAFYKKESKA